jgi:hypothetical protein
MHQYLFFASQPLDLKHTSSWKLIALHYLAENDMLPFTYILFIGICSTLFMDMMSLISHQLFKINAFNYALLGRWVLYWQQKKFTHNNIQQSPPQKYEASIGWFFHYLIGILWTYLYFILSHFLHYTITLWNTIIFSIITTFIPFLIIQPALGFGMFAQKTPNPFKSMRNSMLAHLYFGLGLYLFFFITQNLIL